MLLYEEHQEATKYPPGLMKLWYVYMYNHISLEIICFSVGDNVYKHQHKSKNRPRTKAPHPHPQTHHKKKQKQHMSTDVV